MKQNKFTLASIMVFAPLAVMAAGSPKDWKVFSNPRPLEKVSKISDERPQNAQETNAATANLLKAAQPSAQDPNTFLSFQSSGSLRAPAYRAEGGWTEQLDSIVHRTSDGIIVAKEVYTYTPEGRAARCDMYNYVESEGGYIPAGYVSYDYDEEGRVVLSEQVTIMGPSQAGEQIITAYSGDNVISIIHSQYMNGEWIPDYKNEYAYDSQNNCTEEMFSTFNASDGKWDPYQRATATYDAQNRITSYFPYDWENGAWVGTKAPNVIAQTFVYTSTGKDDEVLTYKWIDSDWLAYKKDSYTYDERDNMTEYLTQYWNPDNQDWNGNYDWSGRGILDINDVSVNQYDSENRIVNTLVKQQSGNNNEFVTIYEETHSYEIDDNGNTTDTTDTYNYSKSGTKTPGSHRVQTLNPFGTEIYYLSSRYQVFDGVGQYNKGEEDFRYMDEYNNYLGQANYAFSNDKENVRYASSKEEVTYPEGWQPELRQNTPQTITHWRGTPATGDETWYPRDKYEYEWDNGEMSRCWMGYYYDGKTLIPYTDVFYTVDTNVSADSLLMWKLNLWDIAYKFKVIEYGQYYNNSTTQTEWQPENSLIRSVYWSKCEPTGVSHVSDQSVTEVARYNISGMRLKAPAQGINIVEYSDGSVRKVLVK